MLAASNGKNILEFDKTLGIDQYFAMETHDFTVKGIILVFQEAIVLFEQVNYYDAPITACKSLHCLNSTCNCMRSNKS
jgi:hypothetical protein